MYLGNFLDFLEFCLFVAFLPLISQQFFENHDPNTRVLISYALLAVGFLGRPIGAYALGKIGDRFSRKKLLVISVSGISLSSLFLCLIPVYPFSWILIAGCRLLQGIFTGAEFSAATVYLVENGTHRQSFKQIAYLTSSGIVGAAFAQLIALFISTLYPNPYSWRVCFIIVSSVGLFVALQRLRFMPTTPFHTQQTNPINLKDYIPQIFIGFTFGGLINGIFYFINSFMNNYQMIIGGNVVIRSMVVNFISTAVFAGSLLLLSRSDIVTKSSPAPVMMSALIGIFLSLFPLFYFSTHEGHVFYILLTQICLVFCCQTFALHALTHVPFLFPEKVRVQGNGLAISLGNSFLGGGTPFISAALTQFIGSPYAPMLYFFLLIGVTSIGLMLFSRKQHQTFLLKEAA